MSKKKKKKGHLHVYKRVRLGKSYEVFRCMLSQCSHYIFVSLLEGREARCRCGNSYVVDARAAKLVWPRCQECFAKRSDAQVRKKKLTEPEIAFLESLMGEEQ